MLHRRGSNLVYSVDQTVGQVRAAQARVSRGAGGYAVDMTGGRRDAAAMTFAELASFALLPWYEASRVAVISDGAWAASIGPETVAPIRKVLLIARDMLDVFSPVFPDQDKGHRYLAKAGNNNDRDRSLWKELRTLYRRGYEEMGELHIVSSVSPFRRQKVCLVVIAYSLKPRRATRPARP